MDEDIVLGIIGLVSLAVIVGAVVVTLAGKGKRSSKEHAGLEASSALMHEKNIVDVRKFLNARPAQPLQPPQNPNRYSNAIALLLAAVTSVVFIASEMGWIEPIEPPDIDWKLFVSWVNPEPFTGLSPFECAMFAEMTNSMIEMQRLFGQKEIKIPDTAKMPPAQGAVVKAVARCKNEHCMQRVYARCYALNPR